MKILEKDLIIFLILENVKNIKDKIKKNMKRKRWTREEIFIEVSAWAFAIFVLVIVVVRWN